MKKLSIAMLFSSCLALSTLCNTSSCETAENIKKCCENNRCQSMQFDNRLTWEKIDTATYMYIEIKRDGASDAMWERISEIVEQAIPEVKARLIGAESDTISYMIKREDLNLIEWDDAIASNITRFQNLMTLLNQAECSGLITQILLDCVMD